MSQSPSSYAYLTFNQGDGPAVAADLSQAAESAPRLVTDYLGYSIHAVWQGNPKATVVVRFSNASVANGQLVGPPDWVTIPDLSLAIGGKDEPSPALLDVNSGRVTWVSLLITPDAAGQNPGYGTFRFGGTRRAG